MSVYSNRNKGWRYDFTKKGIRHTEAGFKTKAEALRAEAIRKEEILNPQQVDQNQTGMGFFDLVNLRLDHVKAYNTASHYKDYCYKAKKWVKRWGSMACKDITPSMIEKFILQRNKVSPFTANNEIRYLRATFNFGKKRTLIDSNPTDGVEFLPTEKRVKHIPSVSDIKKVIQQADDDTQDYLRCICDTMARMSEINRLTWKDVDLENKAVVLYTRKKKGGHLSPRKIPMTQQVYDILQRRFHARDKGKVWVFWHRYFDRIEQEWKEGPYKDRKRIMGTLCNKAGVKYFRFHALRHAGASVMDHNNVPLGAIQRILGHENRSTTEIYLHNIGSSEKTAMNIYEQVVNNSHTESHIKEKKG